MVADILPPSPTSTANTNTQQNESTLGVPDVVESSSNGVVVSVPPTPEPPRQQQVRSPILTTMMDPPTAADIYQAPITTNHRGIQIDTDDEEQARVIPLVVEEEIPNEAVPPTTEEIPTAAATTSRSELAPGESDNTTTEHSYRGRSNVARVTHEPTSPATYRGGAAVIPTSPIAMMHHSSSTTHPNAFVHPPVVTRSPHHQSSILLNASTSPLSTPISSYTSNPVNHRCINLASGKVLTQSLHFSLFIMLTLFIRSVCRYQCSVRYTGRSSCLSL